MNIPTWKQALADFALAPLRADGLRAILAEPGSQPKLWQIFRIARPVGLTSLQIAALFSSFTTIAGPLEQRGERR